MNEHRTPIIALTGFIAGITLQQLNLILSILVFTATLIVTAPKAWSVIKGWFKKDDK